MINKVTLIMLMHYKSCSRIFCEFFCGLFDFFSKVHILKKPQKNWSTDLDIDYHGSAWSFDALRSTTLIEWYFFLIFTITLHVHSILLIFLQIKRTIYRNEKYVNLENKWCNNKERQYWLVALHFKQPPLCGITEEREIYLSRYSHAYLWITLLPATGMCSNKCWQ